MTLQESSLWQAAAPAPKSFANKPLPAQTAVIIVGGGYTGVSAALQLAKLGVQVTLLEAQTIGWGASSRNGGQVLTGQKHGVLEMIKEFGEEKARAMFMASVKTIEVVESIIAAEKIECDYERNGHIEAAFKPGHFAGYQRVQEVLARWGHATRIIPRDQQRNELGSDTYHGLFIDDRSGGLQPAKYINGLALAADRRGADLHEATPVASIRKNGSGFLVQTARGSIQCKDVFVATNGYTSRVTPYFQRRIIPIGSYIIATHPLRTDLAERLIPKRRAVFDSKNFLYYFRLSPDNRMVFGGRAGFFPETRNTIRQSVEILRKGMIAVFPELRDIAIDYAWGGTLGFTFDIYPHAGRNEDGVYYAMGYAGHGVAMATYLGQQIANRIAGESCDNPFEGMTFPTIPFYDGRPWFLPFAWMVYAVRDLIE
jgi:glycine/D-amino acid oxidase-like deaminating enzyme